MKKLLSVILMVCLAVSMSVSVKAVTSNPFIDVSDEAWYHEDVIKAVETGIINGKTDTEFMPEDFLTYAEAVKLAACMNQVYLTGDVTLTNGEPWFKPYVDYCEKNGIITREYNYSENATRAGYMEIFAKALPDEAFEEINNVPAGSIPDVATDDECAIYVYKLYRAGIVTGVDDIHSCNPDASIKRCEVATIIARMMDEDKREEFDMSESKGTLSNEGTIDDIDDVGNPATENIVEEFENKPTAEPTAEPVPAPTDDPILSGEDVEIDPEKYPAIVVTPENTETPEFEVGEGPTLSILTIYKQPEGSDGEEYGTRYELEVQVYGGKAPYSYQWFYYTGYRNNTDKIANGDYVKDVTSEALVLSIEKENDLLGKKIYCEITDSEGTTVKTDIIKVYGPFSMLVDESLNDSGNNILTGRVADGILKKGEKVSVMRGGKVIAIGIAEDLQMFNKSMDKTVKGENIGIVFNREDGVRPTSGDIVVKYQLSHIIDTSDIVN